MPIKNNMYRIFWLILQIHQVSLKSEGGEPERLSLSVKIFFTPTIVKIRTSKGEILRCDRNRSLASLNGASTPIAELSEGGDRYHRSSRFHKKTSKRSLARWWTIVGCPVGPATRRSLKYSSESVFDGQSGRTKSHDGRSLFRIRLFYPTNSPPKSPADSQSTRWTAEREKRKELGQKRIENRG